VPDAAIITAIVDGYDDLKPVCPQEGLDCEWVLVTDNPAIGDSHDGWRVVHESRPGASPVRAAKHPKFRPWEYTQAPASVWIDGSIRVTSPRFATEALALADPIAQFDHPDRDCIYQEAQVAAALPRYAAEPILQQAAAYGATGHPAHWGLWAATVIARRHTDLVKALGWWWTAEVERWSCEDQVSQPYVLRNLGLRPAILPGYYRHNQWLTLEPSGKHW
jgi:TOD1/MUCI70, glycosyltransferase-like domain